MTDIEANKALVRSFIDAISHADVEFLDRVYAPGSTCWTSGNTLISGRFQREENLQRAAGVLGSFPDGLTFNISAMTAEGERVAVEAQSTGVHVSGQLYSNLYHFLFRIKDGQVLELKEYMDTELVTDILCGGQRPKGTPA